MNIFELETPCTLLDMDKLEKNIKKFQKLADENNKELWPMLKTHKSIEIAKLQKKEGAKGFLVGTLDEAELLISNGIKDIIYAYPIIGEEKINRIIDLNSKSNLFISLDSKEQFKELNKLLKIKNEKIKVLIIINSGLNRFGIDPSEVKEFINEMEKYKQLIFKGIGTHPGQVYGSRDLEDVKLFAEEEENAINIAVNELRSNNIDYSIIATGSTPTFHKELFMKNVNILRPGNYVFFDNIQKSMGIVNEDSCSLTVLGTILSKPKKDLFIIDVGSKSLGLDKGAHGVGNIKGYGYIKGHDELRITDLSEEVGKVKIENDTNLKIGDKIKIIPNHSCSAANMTDYLLCHKNKKVIKSIKVDARSGRLKRI